MANVEDLLERLDGIEERVTAALAALDELEEWRSQLVTALSTVSVALSPRCTSGTGE